MGINKGKISARLMANARMSGFILLSTFFFEFYAPVAIVLFVLFERNRTCGASHAN